MENLDLIKSILDLGMSGLLLYFLLVVWKDRQEEKKYCRETLNGKDNYIRDLNKEVLDVVKENTKTQETLRSSIEEHIKATETLTNRIYDALDK